MSQVLLFFLKVFVIWLISRCVWFLLQAQEDVSKNLLQIKNMLYGTSDAEPQTDIIVAQLAQELYNSNLLLLLIQNLSRIDFEVRLLRKFGTGRIGNVAVSFLESSWNVMAHSAAWEGKWRGNWQMERVASTLHTASEHGVSSITTADVHISAAGSRLNWRPCRFKWTRPFCWKTKSVFCVCAITFQMQSTVQMYIFFIPATTYI